MLNELSDRLRAAAHRLKVRMSFTRPAKPINTHRVSNPWSAVSIKPSLVDVCSAAQKLQGKRFLSKEAPKLPLPSCNLPHKCACRFLHHADRRVGARRAEDHGVRAPMIYTGNERRKAVGMGAGRRCTDY